MTDNLEIQDLKDCLLLEQEEKNELNKKLQDLEKECMLLFSPVSFVFFFHMSPWCLFGQENQNLISVGRVNFVFKYIDTRTLKTNLLTARLTWFDLKLKVLEILVQPF